LTTLLAVAACGDVRDALDDMTPDAEAQAPDGGSTFADYECDPSRTDTLAQSYEDESGPQTITTVTTHYRALVDAGSDPKRVWMHATGVRADSPCPDYSGNPDITATCEGVIAGEAEIHYQPSTYIDGLALIHCGSTYSRTDTGTLIENEFTDNRQFRTFSIEVTP
jgi:hypothetical protein